MFDALFEPAKLLTYFFVVIRTSAMMFTVPVFGSTIVKPQLRMAFAIITGVIIYPFVPPVPLTYDYDAVYIALLIFREILIGIAIGTLTATLFTGVQLGGYLLDFQMGFSMVNVIDPESGGSFSYMSQVQNVLTILLFIAVGGPRLILESINYSFAAVPPGVLDFNSSALLYAVTLMGKVFIVAITLTAPPLIVLMATNAILGVMARIIPQINLLVVGFPIKIGLGMIMFIFSLYFFYIAFEKIMFNYFKHIRELLNLM